MELFSKFVGPGINAKVAEARKDPNAIVLDVRTPEEYAQGHIEGAVNVPLDRIQEAVPLYGNKRLYVHCASGARSKQAVAQLKAAGLTNVENIGGIMSWNGPVVTE
ncbi:MAG: rhodanese-like domain-containing protein [Coriobacteriales bacterium]|nr:rhodanese-like domain-containing protein [Coriobacteriales bacterium]